jgi:23S rRNA (guanosine2251-2'-O)-methyltransferase
MPRVVYGIHPVSELLRARPESVIEVRYADAAGGRARELVSLAQASRVRISKSEREAITRFAGSPDHQGAAAMAGEYAYSEVGDMLPPAGESGEKALIVALDGVQDPRNMGSIMRSAYLLGAHGVIIPRDRSVQVTPVVCKASSGAVEHLRVAAVPNLARTLDMLRKGGLWIVGTAAEGGRPPGDIDLKLPAVIVIGGESGGMRRLTGRMCDFTATIPCRDAAFSFNASVAAALVLAEAARQRSARGRLID